MENCYLKIEWVMKITHHKKSRERMNLYHSTKLKLLFNTVDIDAENKNNDTCAAISRSA